MRIDLIKRYIPHLTEKDQKIAEKFLEERKLYELKDLVDSAIIIHEREAKKENPDLEIAGLNKKELLLLKSSVDAYLMNIDPSYFDDFDEY